MSHCQHIEIAGGVVSHCAHRADPVVLPTPAGRPPAIGGPYCEDHGGTARGTACAEREWHYVAPASVGDAAAVDRAGRLCLRTEHAYLVIRPEREIWLAWRGLGSALIQLQNPAGSTARQRRAALRHPDTPAPATGPAYAFRSREDAEAEARRVWRTVVSRAVEGIRSARGGTLAWGVPVESLIEPRVIVLGEHGSAWDVAESMPRVGVEGLSMISGLRPSGEVT